jgi:hypothetical protein
MSESLAQHWLTGQTARIHFISADQISPNLYEMRLMQTATCHSGNRSCSIF